MANDGGKGTTGESIEALFVDQVQLLLSHTSWEKNDRKKQCKELIERLQTDMVSIEQDIEQLKQEQQNQNGSSFVRQRHGGQPKVCENRPDENYLHKLNQVSTIINQSLEHYQRMIIDTVIKLQRKLDRAQRREVIKDRMIDLLERRIKLMEAGIADLQLIALSQHINDKSDSDDSNELDFGDAN